MNFNSELKMATINVEDQQCKIGSNCFINFENKMRTSEAKETFTESTQTIIYIKCVSSSRSACVLYKEITTVCSCHSRSHPWIVSLYIQPGR